MASNYCVYSAGEHSKMVTDDDEFVTSPNICPVSKHSRKRTSRKAKKLKQKTIQQAFNVKIEENHSNKKQTKQLKKLKDNTSLQDSSQRGHKENSFDNKMNTETQEVHDTSVSCVLCDDSQYVKKKSDTIQERNDDNWSLLDTNMSASFNGSGLESWEDWDLEDKSTKLNTLYNSNKDINISSKPITDLENDVKSKIESDPDHVYESKSRSTHGYEDIEDEVSVGKLLTMAVSDPMQDEMRHSFLLTQKNNFNCEMNKRMNSAIATTKETETVSLTDDKPHSVKNQIPCKNSDFYQEKVPTKYFGTGIENWEDIDTESQLFKKQFDSEEEFYNGSEINIDVDNKCRRKNTILPVGPYLKEEDILSYPQCIEEKAYRKRNTRKEKLPRTNESTQNKYKSQQLYYSAFCRDDDNTDDHFEKCEMAGSDMQLTSENGNSDNENASNIQSRHLIWKRNGRSKRKLKRKKAQENENVDYVATDYSDCHTNTNELCKNDLQLAKIPKINSSVDNRSSKSDISHDESFTCNKENNNNTGIKYDNQAESDSETWFDKEDAELLSPPTTSSCCPTSADNQTVFEESCQKLTESRNDQKECFFGSDMLKNGIDLDDRYVEQLNQSKRHQNTFYTSNRGYDKLLSLCTMEPHRYKKCDIDILNAHRAVCTPVDSSEPIAEIEIAGRSKCGMAFTEDEVVVKILSDVPKTTQSENRFQNSVKPKQLDKKIYGEVVETLERHRHKDIRHPVFICVLDEKEGHLMKPLCKTLPKLHILHSKILKKYHEMKKHKVEVYKYNEADGELQFKKYFDVIPTERNNYIFVVAFLYWNYSSMYPCGAVIDVVLSDGDMSIGLNVIALQNQVPMLYKKSTVETVQRLVETFNNDNITSLISENRQDLSASLSVFTVDPPHAKDLDDAFSLQRLGSDLFIVGVHIADVSSIVRKGDNIDIEARDRATTFYSGQGFKSYHMLPEPLSINMCSLIPKKKRPALSLLFKMDSSGRLLEEPEIKKTIVMSCRQMTYKDVQNVLFESSSSGGKINEDIKHLYKLAFNLRKRRLQDAIYALPVEIDILDEDDDSVLQSLQAHWLVEEFMVLANNTIGGFVRRKFPKCTLLRCQDGPKDDIVQSWLESHPYIADIIMHLQNKKLSEDREISIQRAPNVRYTSLISFQKWVWKCIEEAVREDNFPKAWKLLAMDELHPEQALAYEEWISFQETAVYKCSDSLEQNENHHDHFSLKVNNYAHFTSPIRRYSDIIIHRLVHAVLDDTESPYSVKEIQHLCSQINIKSKCAKRYQKNCRMLTLAHNLNKEPKFFHGYVQDVFDRGVLLYFPGLRSMPKQYREIPFSLLDVNSKPEFKLESSPLRPQEPNKQNYVVLQWQKRLYRYNGYPRHIKMEQKESYIVEPNQRAAFLRYKDFIPILKSLITADEESLKGGIDSIRDEVNYEMSTNWLHSKEKHVKDVTSEVQTGIITKHHCDFKFSFHINQVVAVQMSAESCLGLLTPKIQVFDMTTDVKCCLSHIEDPVKVLAQPAVKSTCSTYNSLNDYKDIWLPILEMESATNAVCYGDAVIINNMPIKFKGKQGIFSNTRSYFEKRDIIFDSMSIDLLKDIDTEGKNEESDDADEDTCESKGNESEDYVRLSSSDFLCIRFPQLARPSDDSTALQPKSQKIWVGHANITKLRKKRASSFKEKQALKNNTKSVSMLEIVFKLHPQAPNPPTNADSTTKCCVEILRKPPINRRIESYLKMIEDASPLAKAIALGQKKPILDKTHLDVAETVGTDIDITDMAGNRILAKNNKQQKRAIDKALRSSFSLIQGPPGTGKTYTGIKLIYLYNELNAKLREITSADRKQIVFCGPSNKSVDLVARWMKEKLGDYAPRLIRMYGSSYETLDFPVPGKASMSSRTLRNFAIDEDLLSQGLVLHFVIRENGKPYAEELKAYDTKFQKIIKQSRPGINKKINENYILETLDMKDLRKYSEILNEAKREELKNYDVIFCTTSVAANPSFLKSVNGRIYQCIIDECGMCTEPESMVPIIATQAKQVVLIGDHKQLQPVVNCSEAADLGLERSLFERYADLGGHFTMLTAQYRMNPDICLFPSKKFYGGKLTTEHSLTWEEKSPLQIWKRNKNIPDPLRKHIPHLFCHIEGEEEVLTVTTEEGNERSRSNLNEVEHVVKVRDLRLLCPASLQYIKRKMMENQHGTCNWQMVYSPVTQNVKIYRYLINIEEVKPWKINVISQYNAQCNELKKAFKKYGLEKTLVNTVVSSQGGEWDYVIFSTVRSLPKYMIEPNPSLGWCKQNLGFIIDEHQINVALTRARKGLIIIGNQNLLRCNEVWRDLLKHYKERQCIVNVNTFPPKLYNKSGRFM